MKEEKLSATLQMKPEEMPLRCSVELSAQIVGEIVTELKGIRETLEKLVTQNKWEKTNGQEKI